MGAMIFGVIGLGVVAYLLRRVVIAAKHRRLVAGAVSANIRDLPMGLVRLQGRAQPLAPMTDPIFGQPCAFYRITVATPPPVRGKKEVVTELADTSGDPFWLADDTGRVLIDPEGADIRWCETMEFCCDELPPAHPARRYVQGFLIPDFNGWRLRVEIARPEAVLQVLGQATPILLWPGLAQLLKSDRARMGALDKNQDGQIDVGGRS
jgi:hypothetical protein